MAYSNAGIQHPIWDNGGAGINVLARGAKGNGSADDTAAFLETALEAVAKGVPMIVPDTGSRYAISRFAVTGTGVESLIIAGDGTIEASVDPSVDVSASGILASGLARFIARGVRMRYSGTFDPGSKGNHSLLQADNCDLVLIDGADTQGASRNGTYLTECRRVMVRDAVASSNRSTGLSIVHCKDVQVVGGFYDGNGVETDANTGYGISMPGGVVGDETARAVIMGVHARNNWRKGLDAHACYDFLATLNHVYRNHTMGIYAHASQSGVRGRRIHVVRNFVTGGHDLTTEYRAISAGGSLAGAICDEVVVDDNDIRDVRDYAIRVFTHGVRRVKVRRNIVDGVRQGVTASQGVLVGAESVPQVVEYIGNDIRNAATHAQIARAKVAKVHQNTYGIPAAAWQAETAYQEGDVVHPVAGGSVFRVADGGGGTTGASEPTWPTAYDTPVVDGTVTWVLAAPAAFRGLRLGSTGVPMGGALEQSGDHFDVGWSDVAISGEADPYHQRGNYLGDDNLHPEPIVLSLPIQAVGTTAGTTVTKDIMLVPADRFVTVMFAGGRRLTSTRVGRVIMDSVTLYTHEAEPWGPTGDDTRHSSGGTAKLLQLEMSNAGVDADMAFSVAIRIAKRDV